MVWGARAGWKHPMERTVSQKNTWGLNGLGSPFGMETALFWLVTGPLARAKWPGKPVRDGNRLHLLYQRKELMAKWPGKPVRDGKRFIIIPCTPLPTALMPWEPRSEAK